ncbi:MAG: glycosyltransferase family 4 protein [Acidimicrobiia bacterium]|nr:glycosyltransferase family 4 protein [Acidimicrobiia bacterium]
MREKTLLLLVASDRRRGAEVFGERLGDGLRRRGWDVDFAAIQASGSDRVVAAEPLSPPEAGGRINRRTVAALRRRMAESNPAIVLANGGATLRYAVIARSLLRRRPLLAYGSIGEPRYWLRSPRHRLLQRFFQQRADLVLAVSRETREQLISDLGVKPARIKVAPTGVPPEFFMEKRPRSGELRLLFLGSLSNEKNPHAAVDVAAGIGGNARLRLVGAGPLAEELAARSATMPGDVGLELTGSVGDVTPHLDWADLLLLTSHSEGLPGAVLESGAAGVPALAFAVGGTGETMIDGETGMLFRPGDVAGMVAAARELTADRTRLEEMGKAQRDYVRTHYTLEQAIDRFDDFLSSALQEAK